MAHMVWGKGGLLNAFLGGKIPCFDFAGGTVVHITSGVSALVCALYLGKRVGYPDGADEAAQPGAQLHRRLPAVGGLVRLQRGQRARRVAAWPPAPSSRRTSAPPRRRSAGCWPNGCTAASRASWAASPGAVAGLVAITPASGFVKPLPALLIGFAAGRRLLSYGDAGEAASSATTIRSMPSACTARAERWARS